MWIKNIKTGHVWNVSDEIGKRLLKSDDFEVVDEPKRQSKRQIKSDVDEQSK